MSTLHKDKIGLGIASLPNLSIFEAIDKTRELGFKTLELVPFGIEKWAHGYIPGFQFDEFSSNEKREFKKRFSCFSHISSHAPFVNTPLFVFNKGIQREVLNQIKQSIDVTSFLNGSMVTVHANPKSPFLKEHEYWEEMVDTFRELGDYAKDRNVKIGIETLFPDKVSRYISLIFEIDHPAVGATIDVGHMFYYINPGLHKTPAGVEKFNGYLRKMLTTLKGKVYHLHLHNVRARDWKDHFSVNNGIIDYPELFSVLKEIKYNNLMVFEFGGTYRQVIKWAVDSKKRIEELLVGDDNDN